MFKTLSIIIVMVYFLFIICIIIRFIYNYSCELDAYEKELDEYEKELDEYEDDIIDSYFKE